MNSDLSFPTFLISLKALNDQFGLYNQKHADSWKSVIKKNLKKGSKFAFQISHSGISTEKHLENKETTKEPRLFSSLTKSDIQDILLTNSAIVAKNAGADGVEHHGAHGHLLSIFLSPYYNHRDDEYENVERELSKKSPNLFETVVDQIFQF